MRRRRWRCSRPPAARHCATGLCRPCTSTHCRRYSAPSMVTAEFAPTQPIPAVSRLKHCSTSLREIVFRERSSQGSRSM